MVPVMGRRFTDLSRPERFAAIATYLIIAGGTAVLIAFGAYAYHFYHHPIGDTGDWGAFGAFVSGVAGTALSAFTLAALAFALGLQAQELAESRALAVKQFKILEEQTGTLHKQAFESTFFRLLQRFTAISNRLQKRNVIAGFLRSTDAHFLIDSPTSNLREWVERKYECNYREREHELGPYYRTLFHVIRFVDTADLSDSEKAGYIALARAQLGADELILLFMNVAFHSEGRIGMKPFVERYGLLRHVRNTEFPDYLKPFKDSEIKRSAYQSRAERETAMKEA